jgi:cold shock CspA family protein
MTQENKTYLGEVNRLLEERGCGFIKSDELDRDVYFKISSYRGTPSLCKGDRVEFHVKRLQDGKLQTNDLIREGENRERLRELSGNLLDWAYIGNHTQVLQDLRGKALKERWEFRRQPDEDKRPLPILFNYLKQTFSRLQSENKVHPSEDGKFAAFNTGLVDNR